MVVKVTEHERLVRGLFRAIETDAPASELAALFHPDGEQVELPSLIRPHGHRRPLPEMLEGYAAGRALLARQSYEILDVVDDGERLAVQLRWTATTAVEARSLPAGSELVAHIAAFYEFRDGRILRQSSYDCYEPLPTAV